MTVPDHASRVAAEVEHFRVNDIHALPEIFHYWSNNKLPPLLHSVFGQSDMHAILADELRRSLLATGNPLIVSIGAGDGVIEILLAERLLAEGFKDFRFECVELSDHLIARGLDALKEKGLGEHVGFTQADLTFWKPSGVCGAAFAHHSLHHIAALEHVFNQVHGVLAPEGAFVTADMIGRNGHMRWPETLSLVERLWKTIPEHYKYHHLFQRQMTDYLNWDCSSESFEGIRAQEIIPLLADRFHFEKFCAWGGLTDIFIDRAYGHNLDPTNPADTGFIDQLWDAECALLRAKAITPTAMVAVMRKQRMALRSSFGLSAEDCIRPPDAPRPDPSGRLDRLVRILRKVRARLPR